MMMMMVAVVAVGTMRMKSMDVVLVGTKKFV